MESNYPKRKIGPLVVLTLLWGGCVVSALAVVGTTHEVRNLIQTLEAQRLDSSQLHMESGRFLLEKSAWSDFARIESIAERDLKMTIPGHDNTILVKRNEF